MDIKNSLLKDPVFVDKVKQTVLEVITEYECDENENLQNPNKRFAIDGQLLWEKNKFKVRGIAVPHTK